MSFFWWRRFFHFVSLFCCVKGYKKDKVVHLHIMFTHFEPIKVMPPPLFYAGWTLFSGSVMSSCVERWDNHRQLAVGKKKTYSLHLENIVILITKRYEHFPTNSNGNNWLDHTIQCGFLCISVCGGYSSPLTHYVYAFWTMPPPLFSTNWTLFSGSAMSS